MEWHIGEQLMQAISGQKKVEKLAAKLGARFVPVIGRKRIDLASPAPHAPEAAESADDADISARDAARHLNIDIPWDQVPFRQVADQAAVYNYVGMGRPYGLLAAYELDSPLPTDSTGAFDQQPDRAFVYDFSIPNQVADPTLTPDEDDDADVDLPVRPPDADADIRFLEDYAAAMCDAPRVFDLTGHHVVIMTDLGMVERQSFYLGLEKLLGDGEDTPVSAPRVIS